MNGDVFIDSLDLRLLDQNGFIVKDIVFNGLVNGKKASKRYVRDNKVIMLWAYRYKGSMGWDTSGDHWEVTVDKGDVTLLQPTEMWICEMLELDRKLAIELEGRGYVVD